MIKNNHSVKNNCKLKILFLTSCTGDKKYKPTNQLIQDDFKQIGTDWFSEKEGQLEKYRLPAKEMYTGQQHLRLMRGLDLLRESCPEVQIDLKVISAGYGLMDADFPVVPYEVTFSDMRAKELREWADFLQIPSRHSQHLKDTI